MLCKTGNEDDTSWVLSAKFPVSTTAVEEPRRWRFLPVNSCLRALGSSVVLDFSSATFYGFDQWNFVKMIECLEIDYTVRRNSEYRHIWTCQSLIHISKSTNQFTCYFKPWLITLFCACSTKEEYFSSHKKLWLHVLGLRLGLLRIFFPTSRPRSGKLNTQRTVVLMFVSSFAALRVLIQISSLCL